MRWWFRFACVLALGGCAKAQEFPALRVGTWNLENLGSRENPRQAEDFARIAALILRLDIQVLALQEINGERPMRQLLEHLGPDYEFVLGKSGKVKGPQNQELHLNLGFLWNRTKVQLLQSEELHQLRHWQDGKPLFHRLPLNAYFAVTGPDGKRRLDFHAVCVHLKAHGGEENERQRVLEVQALRRHLQRLLKDKTQDQDILVLGDFNHAPGDPAHLAFTEGGLVAYLQAEPPAPTILRSRKAIDHVAVVREIETEVLRGSLRVHTPKGAARKTWRQVYSDHFPVTVELDTSHDRD